MEKLSFFINNQMVYVDYIVTKNKNMYLRVTKDNSLQVSAPERVPREEVEKFVNANLKRFLKYMNKSKANAPYSFEEKFVHIFGHKYPLQFITGVLKPECRISGKVFYILSKNGTNAENEKALIAYLKENLFDYIAARQIYYEKKMQVPYHDVKVVNKTTTWGTNNIRTKSISYSAKLLHFNKKVIDYVIIHELAHYHVPNHSDNFWAVVEKFMPDYKENKKELRSDETLTEE